MDISYFLDQIKASNRYENQIVHNEKIPAHEALYTSLDLKAQVKKTLSGIGIKELYTHQVEAIEKVREGKDIVLCTTTASGKSLTYMELKHYSFYLWFRPACKRAGIQGVE